MIDCKMCGQRHKAGDDCPKAAKRIKVFVPEKEGHPETSPYKAGDELKIVVASNAIEPDLKAGYNAYMRDYMRKKRAKDKAK